ncbi:MAG: hypothetical protein LAN71_07620 [Acidobacteriia bacterium]|nr:hypothetical protein [Terriglobia bacterium]
MAMNIPAKVICMSLCGAILLAPLAFSQIPRTAPAPPKGVQPQQPSGKIPAATPYKPIPSPTSGTISGMISWDTTKIQPGTPGVCQGLQIYAVQGTFPQTNAAPVGQTKLLPYQLQGNNGECPFEIDGVPVGVGLTVHYRVNQGAFKPVVVAFGQTGSFEIPGGPCGGPGHVGRTTVDGIEVCGNSASGVILRLEALSSVPQPMSATSGQNRMGALSAIARNLGPAAGMAGPGTISGLVWWDTNIVKTGLAPMGDICSATGVTVVVHETVKGQQFPSSVQVGSTPHWPVMMGSGAQGMNILKVGSIVACLFTITGLPLKTDLTVLVNPSPEIFLPRGGGNLPHATGPSGPVNLPGGSCASAPPQPTTLAQFRAPLVYCGNGAYNANFSLKPTIL